MNRHGRDGKRELPKFQKILLIDLGATFGGVESYVINLTYLLKDKADVRILCVLPELARQLEAAGAPVFLLPLFKGPLKPLRFAVALFVLPFVLCRFRIQTVQVNGFLESALMLPARLLRRRTVYTRHGPFELGQYRWYRDPLRFLPRVLARMSVPLAKEVVCVSETVGTEVRAIRPPLRVTVIPNWLASQPPRHQVRAAPVRQLEVLCVSRLERYKGVHLLIEAMLGIEGARLTVVGDGPYRGDLTRLCEGLPVRFAGFQKDMASYYEAADIFVMPSLGPEGLPMSTLEAMGRGVPSILSDLPVHREMTMDGQAAVLFRSGDVNSLRSSLQLLLSDMELRRRISAAAYELVQERYTTTSVQSAYLKVFGIG